MTIIDLPILRGPTPVGRRLMLCVIGLAAALALTGGSALAQGPQRAKQLSLTACYYSKGYTGRVASGPRYDPQKLTAAHRTLPFGTKLRVTSRKSGRSVTVVVNDRGPFTKRCRLDLSFAAAKTLRMINSGLARVSVVVE
jgi:rare lipoprotein A